MISLTDGLVRWGLMLAAVAYVAWKIYSAGHAHGYAKRDAELQAATAALNRKIESLTAKQRKNETTAQERVQAAVRAAQAVWQDKRCRVLSDAERGRLDAIGD